MKFNLFLSCNSSLLLDVSVEAKTFKCNPNTRDLKGWTCVCIAVFHDSLKVLQVLLENGGDPNIRSSYNKNAWDLSKVFFHLIYLDIIMIYYFTN